MSVTKGSGEEKCRVHQQLILGNLLRLPLLFFVRRHNDERTSVETFCHVRMEEVGTTLKEHESG
jgi:hypothetical protein